MGDCAAVRWFTSAMNAAKAGSSLSVKFLTNSYLKAVGLVAAVVGQSRAVPGRRFRWLRVGDGEGGAVKVTL